MRMAWGRFLREAYELPLRRLWVPSFVQANGDTRVHLPGGGLEPFVALFLQIEPISVCITAVQWAAAICDAIVIHHNAAIGVDHSFECLGNTKGDLDSAQMSGFRLGWLWPCLDFLCRHDTASGDQVGKKVQFLLRPGTLL